MKLTVTGRYVDLDFETPVPIKLSQQFSADSVASSAARAIARKLGIRKYEQYNPMLGAMVTMKTPRWKR
jgi:hypothetical protein